MNPNQLSLIVQERKAEDDKDVRAILKSLREDNYTVDRLQLLISNGKHYSDSCERQGFKRPRGNENMIRAGELLLAELTH